MANSIWVRCIAKNKKTRIIVGFMVFLFSLSCLVFAQTDDPVTEDIPQEDERTEIEVDVAKGVPSPFIVTFNWVAIGNIIATNTLFPINFSIGAGAQIKIIKNVSFVPHVQVFWFDYIWTGSSILPATTETPSIFVLSVLADIPVTYDIYWRNSIFRIGGGVSFLLRFTPSGDFKSSEEQSDRTKMNAWFWDNVRFLYPNVQFSWDYVFDNGLALGLSIKTYISIREVMDTNTFDKSMISLGIRIIPPAW